MSIDDRYRQALDKFIEKVKKNDKIIGVLLAGSLYYNFVNEDSDINIILVAVDGSIDRLNYVCIEDDITFNIDVFQRTQIIHNLSKQFGDMYRLSYLTNCEFVFCKDKQLSDYFDEVKRIKKDAFDFSTFCDFSTILYRMSVIRKYLETKKELVYVQYNFVRISEYLAKMEFTMQQKMFSQDVVLEAFEMKSEIMDFFRNAYTETWDKEKCIHALDKLESYFDANISKIQRPILSIFKKSGKTILTLAEISEYYGFYAPFLYLGCNYLAQKEILVKVTIPTTLLKKSKTEVEEVAYLDNNI